MEKHAFAEPAQSGASVKCAIDIFFGSFDENAT